MFLVITCSSIKLQHIRIPFYQQNNVKEDANIDYSYDLTFQCSVLKLNKKKGTFSLLGLKKVTPLK